MREVIQQADLAQTGFYLTFVYVLEGSIVLGVRGGKSVTLTPGQTFYEGPNDIHTVSRNASLTEPAKFLVVLMKNHGEPIVMPAG
jgi:quercetin dioxygenase-like cupin family protein